MHLTTESPNMKERLMEMKGEVGIWLATSTLCQYRSSRQTINGDRDIFT